MSWWRRHIGVDPIETLIHVGVTFAAMIVGASAARQPEEEVVAIALVFAASLLLFWRRRVALRNVPQETSGERAAMRLEDLEACLIELERANVRIAELEERLDFAERLLAQERRSSGLLKGGSP